MNSKYLRRILYHLYKETYPDILCWYNREQMDFAIMFFDKKDQQRWKPYYLELFKDLDKINGDKYSRSLKWDESCKGRFRSNLRKLCMCGALKLLFEQKPSKCITVKVYRILKLPSDGKVGKNSRKLRKSKQLFGDVIKNASSFKAINDCKQSSKQPEHVHYSCLSEPGIYLNTPYGILYGIISSKKILFTLYSSEGNLKYNAISQMEYDIPQVIKQNLNMPQAIEQNLNAPQVIEQNWNLSEANEQNRNTSQVIEQNWNAPQVIEKNWNLSEANEQILSASQAVEQNLNAPQVIEQNWNLSEANEQILSASQAVEQNLNAPQVIEQNWNLSEANEQNRNASQVIKQNWNAPQVIEKNWNLSEANEQILSASQAVEQNLNAPQVMEQNWDAPQVIEQNWNLSEANKQNWNASQAVKQNLSLPQNCYTFIQQNLDEQQVLELKLDEPQVIKQNLNIPEHQILLDHQGNEMIEENFSEPLMVKNNCDVPQAVKKDLDVAHIVTHSFDSSPAVDQNSEVSNWKANNDHNQSSKQPELVLYACLSEPGIYLNTPYGMLYLAYAVFNNKKIVFTLYRTEGNLKSNAISQMEYDIPQAIKQNLNMPQAIEQNLNAPQGIEQNWNLSEANEQNLNASQAVEQNLNGPQMMEQNGNAPEVIEQNWNLCEANQQNWNISHVIEQNLNAPQAVEENSEFLSSDKVTGLQKFSSDPFLSSSDFCNNHERQPMKRYTWEYLKDI